MNAVRQDDDTTVYTTPHRVQAWFLRRSRRRWKRKYMQLKVDTKRLQNRVNDVTKSRESWRDENKQLKQRLRESEAENAALQRLHAQAAQAEGFKKNGRGAAFGRVR